MFHLDGTPFLAQPRLRTQVANNSLFLAMQFAKQLRADLSRYSNSTPDVTQKMCNDIYETFCFTVILYYTVYPNTYAPSYSSPSCNPDPS